MPCHKCEVIDVTKAEADGDFKRLVGWTILWGTIGIATVVSIIAARVPLV